MILNDYKLREDLADVLEKYERDKNVSPIIVVENLLEKFLYDEGYIILDTETEVVKTPLEIYSERKNRFRVTYDYNRCWKLYYGECDFGCFKKDELEEIMDKLLDFSDEELNEMDSNNWKYNPRKYKPFIRQKLENPLLTPEEFINRDKIKISYRDNNIRLTHKGDLIAQFNLNNYSKETVESVYDMIIGWSEVKIEDFIQMRKNSGELSAEYLLNEVKNDSNAFAHKKYCILKDSGKVSIVKEGNNFGTHAIDNVDTVWEFLNVHNWDKQYSTKVVGLKGTEYLDWLYLQIGIVGDD